jgi:hypothetical protein
MECSWIVSYSYCNIRRAVLWAATSCISKGGQRFGEKCRLCLQGRRITQTSKKRKDAFTVRNEDGVDVTPKRLDVSEIQIAKKNALHSHSRDSLQSNYMISLPSYSMFMFLFFRNS